MNHFWKSFLKTAGVLRKEVSTVAVMKDGKMLMGKRRDNDKMTAPGGHLEKDESPLDGAVRELYEESGIKVKPSDLKFIKTITNEDNGYVVHGYRYDVKGDVSTTMKNDPDLEVYRWKFVDTTTIPNEELHVPRTSGNVLLPAMEKKAEAFMTRSELASYANKDNKWQSRLAKLKSRRVDPDLEKEAGEKKVKVMNGDHYQYLIDKKRGDGVDNGKAL